jgi:hypothetical protein
MWTWMGGSSAADQNPVFGTPGEPGTQNIPGARYGLALWTDTTGHVWVFGGLGETGSSANPTTAFLNDLWEFNPSTLEWTLIGGINLAGMYSSQAVSGDPGVYGTLRTPDPGNIPGSRIQATTWTDKQGHLWLFGGAGFDSTGLYRLLGDLIAHEPP